MKQGYVYFWKTKGYIFVVDEKIGQDVILDFGSSVPIFMGPIAAKDIVCLGEL